MHRFITAFSIVALVLVALVATIGQDTRAQEATPSAMAQHPLVGTWIVDTDIMTETDGPQLGVWTSDGIMLGVPGVVGAWEITDEQTALVTFVNVFPDGTGSITIRGPHVVDEPGNTWTSEYSWTVVAPDGMVLDSGTSTARGTRLQVESMDRAGAPLSSMMTWTPAASTDATPAP